MGASGKIGRLPDATQAVEIRCLPDPDCESQELVRRLKLPTYHECIAPEYCVEWEVAPGCPECPH